LFLGATLPPSLDDRQDFFPLCSAVPDASRPSACTSSFFLVFFSLASWRVFLFWTGRNGRNFLRFPTTVQFSSSGSTSSASLHLFCANTLSFPPVTLVAPEGTGGIKPLVFVRAQSPLPASSSLLFGMICATVYSIASGWPPFSLVYAQDLSRKPHHFLFPELRRSPPRQSLFLTGTPPFCDQDPYFDFFLFPPPFFRLF